jgi:uncharacterized protein YunC (DUF1805 family)
MVKMIPIRYEGVEAIAIEVSLPKTTLITVSTEKGYIMCGALDVGLLNERLKDRLIIAGRAVGVKTIEQLLEAPLELVTDEAARRGIVIGMKGREALKLMM